MNKAATIQKLERLESKIADLAEELADLRWDLSDAIDELDSEDEDENS